MKHDPEVIVERLTKDQKQCILNLSEEWKETGYNRVQADILYALGDSDLHDGYGSLVDCRWNRAPNICPNYQHRLLPLGLEVQTLLKSLVEI